MHDRYGIFGGYVLDSELVAIPYTPGLVRDGFLTAESVGESFLTRER